MNLPTPCADRLAEVMGSRCHILTLSMKGDCFVTKGYLPTVKMLHLLPPLRPLEVTIEGFPGVPRQYDTLYHSLNVLNVSPGAGILVINSPLKGIQRNLLPASFQMPAERSFVRGHFFGALWVRVGIG